CQCHGVEVGIDVRVIELDVADNSDIWQVLEELRRFVEKGAVVLVAFDDEFPTLSDTVARAGIAEVARDATNEHAGIDATVRQQPARQRGRRCLAVRTGDDDRARTPQEVLTNGFRKRAVADLSIEDFLELGIAARDRIADDYELYFGRDVFCAIPADSRYSF